jgi:hypothetical protein
MRYILSILIVALLLSACKKDKFTTAPQISFKGVKPDAYFQGSTSSSNLPIITLHVTDAEGDLGFNTGADTAFVYLLNLRTNKFDSTMFPTIGTSSAQKNFEADVDIRMNNFLGVPINNVKDTIYYKIYIKDFAKNKSNEIQTDKPIYYFP